jgi:hypothetical protein
MFEKSWEYENLVCLQELSNIIFTPRYFLLGSALAASCTASSGLRGINACNWKDVEIGSGPILRTTLSFSEVAEMGSGAKLD